MCDTLVLLYGVKATLKEIEALLRDVLDAETSASCIADAAMLETAGMEFGRVLCLCGEALSLQQLTLLAKVLRPGATVVFRPEPDHLEGLRRNCVLSGFLVSDDAMAKPGLLKVKVASWAVGAKTQIAPQPPAKWTVEVDDEDELLDDEAFLNEEDLKPAPLIQSGKAPVKKACENCTCGRAEGKEPVKLTQEMLDNPVTSCGSCGMGDAYRCASCPYRGLPSFEPGKRIELPEGFLISDL